MSDIGTAGPSAARPATLDIANDAYHRLAAAYCLFCGMLYWMQLMGMMPGASQRFDLMSFNWRAASAGLAVLFPFAAVGMWLVAPWGPVVWFLCALIETAMYGLYPSHFGHRGWTLVIHALIGIAYLGFRLALYLRRRQRAAAH